jgi:hypothetical protein
MNPVRAPSPSARPSLASLVMMLVGLCAGVVTSLAHAAPLDLDRVTVHARRGNEPVYTNVRATCPGVEAYLSQVLSLPQARHRSEGITTVTFRLSGASIDEIRQVGGPFEYRSDIRRAVRQMSCQTEGTGKLYVMQLQFVNEPTSDGGNGRSRSVALLSE